jgi:hypothetical protein
MTEQTILIDPAHAAPAVVEPLQPSPQKKKLVKARVLMACEYGEPDDLVEIESSTAKQVEAAGKIDTHKDAVAYAESLPQNNKAD